LSGTPLRMNTAYRHAVNPLDQFRAGMYQDPDTPAVLTLVAPEGGALTSTAFAQFYMPDFTEYPPEYQSPQFIGDTDTRLASGAWKNRVDYTPVTNLPFASGLDIARV